MKKLIYLLSLCLFSCSSPNGKNKKINIADDIENLQPLYVLDFADEVSYIPLETTDSSLIGNRPYIRKFRNTLLVASEKQPIMMFSLENGKFIKTIGNIGQGGNEYILSYDRPVFWADNSEHYIFVKSADDKIQQYDSIGNYVGTIKHPKEIGPLSGLSQIATGDYIYFYRNYQFEDKVTMFANIDSG